jgi:hypothetical protein
MKTFRLTILSLSFAILLALTGASDAADPIAERQLQASDEFTVGVLSHSPPEKYVVVEEVETKTRRIYKKSTYDGMKKDGLNMIQAVSLEEIEYRYKPVSGAVKFVSDEFELVELKEKKAILKKAYIEQREIIDKEEELLPEEGAVPDEVLEEMEEAEKKEPGARRLAASLFFKIKSKKLSDTEWEISLPTILDAAANFGEVLSVVVEKISKLIDSEVSTKVYLKSSLGRVELGPKGLLIESLNSRLRKKTGLKDDDIIKTVNGKNLTAIHDVTGLFSTFTGSPQTITVRFERDEEALTHTYYIR